MRPSNNSANRPHLWLTKCLHVSEYRGARLRSNSGETQMAIKMSRFLLCASLAVIGSTMSPAVADEWNKETKLTFSAPVEIPGKVLDPGKYVFRLLDSSSDRNIVQIFSEDEEGNQ